nr:MAG TPA: hypothetical protein [Caudoviricetes sp.]
MVFMVFAPVMFVWLFPFGNVRIIAKIRKLASTFLLFRFIIVF